MRDNLIFIKQQAETELLWPLGSPYPSQLIATVYEENSIGERRLVEQKTFNLVQAKSEKPKHTKQLNREAAMKRIASKNNKSND